MEELNQEGLINNILNEPHVSYGAKAPLSRYDLLNYSRKGVKKRTALNLIDKMSVSLAEFAPILHISNRTLQRYQDDDLLDIPVSEHVLLIAELYAKGFKIFENEDGFKQWMSIPNRSLGGEKPITLLDTTIGIQLISEEIGRIEHGIFA